MSQSKPKVGAATTIDGVIEQLTAIVGWSASSESRLGYFAALYRDVTMQVRRGIEDGSFDDGARMERFDVVFANRYLEALALEWAGGHPGECWRFAFRTADDYWPIVLQHLLLGMNAHINLDLGIAAATIVRGSEPAALLPDFNRINTILSSLIDGVQRDLAMVWAPLHVLNRFLGSVDDQIIRFKMERAREQAWGLTLDLSRIPAGRWPEAIAAADRRTLEIARLVRHPGPLIGTVTRVVRLGEVRRVGAVVEILSRPGPVTPHQ